MAAVYANSANQIAALKELYTDDAFLVIATNGLMY